MHTLLNMARPRPQERAAVDLQLVIEAALSFLSERLRQRGIESITHFGSVAQVWGDAEKLQQLFLNLFINAADAMRDGGTLEIRTNDRPDGLV